MSKQDSQNNKIVTITPNIQITLPVDTEVVLPNIPWKICILTGGRGFGKTYNAAFIISQIIFQGNCKKIGLLSDRLNNVTNVMLEGNSGIFNFLRRTDFTTNYSRGILRYKQNGVSIQFFGASAYKNLRGYEFDWIWIDELCKISRSLELMEQVYLSLRKGESRLLISTTLNNSSVFQQLETRNDILLIKGFSKDNKHLSENFHDNVENYLDRETQQQELLGRLEISGLWQANDIQYSDYKGRYDRYVLSIDVAIGPGTTGIILCGYVQHQRQWYILEDYSVYGSADWIMTVRNVLNKFPNLEIITEVNNGGNMIAKLMDVYDINCPIQFIRSNAPKELRHSIFLSIFRQLAIKFVKPLPELEKELLIRHKSDRIDALSFIFLLEDNRYHVVEIEKTNLNNDF